jgi:hypothetical protein
MGKHTVIDMQRNFSMKVLLRQYRAVAQAYIPPPVTLQEYSMSLIYKTKNNHVTPGTEFA